MGWVRNFTMPEGHVPRVRNIDSDAPLPMRQELVDLFFSLVDNNPHVLRVLDHEHIYRVSCQNMGQAIAGNPYGGYPYAVGRDIQRVEWQQVYNLICRLWPEFSRADLGELYREGVNRILSAHGIVWDLSQDERLYRVLPAPAQALVESAVRELEKPEFEGARGSFKYAQEAYDDRPRRDPDVCKNIFNALESVAKTVYQMPTKTFGDVLKQIRRESSLDNFIVSVLESIYTLANNRFRHGMTEPFSLSPSEVDFTYLTCIGGILLFARMAPGATP